MRYNINTPSRLRAFLAIVGHETGQLLLVEENLDYDAAGLVATWPKLFDAVKARAYARNPEKIANYVYAGRMGNGDEASGDGWKYRGRGLIQLTGKDNYAAATKGMYALPMGVDFVDNPALLATPEYAAYSAAWFWDSNGLNRLADGLDNPTKEYETFKGLTKRVNGGYIDLSDRWTIYQNLKKILK
jgi:putative chitinase